MSTCVSVPFYLFSNFVHVHLYYSCSPFVNVLIICLVLQIYCSYILRMKEYERERRLMVRRERMAKKRAAEVLAA